MDGKSSGVNPIYVALDTPDIDEAKRLVSLLEGEVGGFKIGLEFFVAHGPDRVREVVGNNRLFLDLKLHDIPATVRGAVRSAARLKPHFITVHTSGGIEMMRAAKMAARESATPPLILGVTVLTSLDTDPREVLRLAADANEAGLDGLVCSSLELPEISSVMSNMTLVVPGIRPEGSATDDQKRIATPFQAFYSGADVLVIGRPITQSADPAQAARTILGTL